MTLHQELNRNRTAGIYSNLQPKVNKCTEILSFKLLYLQFSYTFNACQYLSVCDIQ